MLMLRGGWLLLGDFLCTVQYCQMCVLLPWLEVEIKAVIFISKTRTGV